MPNINFKTLETMLNMKPDPPEKQKLYREMLREAIARLVFEDVYPTENAAWASLRKKALKHLKR